MCVPGAYPPATKGRKQYLVIGDSVSMGYFSALEANLSDWDVVHAPGNNDNTNWGRRCLKGWLGPDPGRWNLVSVNWGLHDLAFPDNEHLDVATYANLLGDILTQLKALAPRAKTMWVTTTPVPTDPPNDPSSGKSCVLIPGRIETVIRPTPSPTPRATKATARRLWTCTGPLRPVRTEPRLRLLADYFFSFLSYAAPCAHRTNLAQDVLKYNAAAGNVTAGRVGSACDLHTVINDFCGLGYRNCKIGNFDIIWERFSRSFMLYHFTRAACCDLLGAHANRVLSGACNPML